MRIKPLGDHVVLKNVEEVEVTTSSGLILAGEVVKMLHTTFGETAVLDKVLLCGNFVDTVDLVPYMSTMLGTECIAADAATLKPGASAAIALNVDDLSRLFPFAATTCTGVDLMKDLKTEIGDRNKTIVLCSAVTVILGGLMVLTPLEKKQLEAQRDAAAAIIEQPAYVAVKDIINQRKGVLQNKQDLIEAIENLPHSESNAAGLISDILTITSGYGSVASITVDYNAETISMKVNIDNYESFVYCQQEITKDGRFNFVQPPSFSGNGFTYAVGATLSATDFTVSMDQEG